MVRKLVVENIRINTPCVKKQVLKVGPALIGTYLKNVLEIMFY